MSALPLPNGKPAIPRAVVLHVQSTGLTCDEIDAPLLKRRQAKAVNARYYRSAKLCPENHNPTVRFVSSGCCVQCVRANSVAYKTLNPDGWALCRAKWQEKNLERRKKTIASWRIRNAERIRIKNAEWRATHPGATKAWGLANPGARRSLKLKRRASLLGCGGSHTANDIREIMEAQRGRCAYCKRGLKAVFHRDHILPLKLGGTNDRSNIQILCQPCNSRKSAKHPVTFAQELGLLL